jgi:mRNA interferase MazF
MARILRGEVWWADLNPLTWALPVGVLPKPAWVKISQVRTLSTERIGRRLARVPESDILKVMEGLKEILGE